MRKLILFSVLLFGFLFVSGISCSLSESLNFDTYVSGQRFNLSVTAGEHYTHKMQVFLFISIKSPPQMAFWIEDTNGNFIRTLYVTEKTAKQTWQKAPADPLPKDEITRQESLPYWCHRRGVTNQFGSFFPTREVPVVDALTGATPKSGFSMISGVESNRQFVIYAEVNASLDFNDAYPADASVGSENYNGGEWGSGQPALVYRVEVDLDDPETVYTLELVGHSSPDGSDGNLYPVEAGEITTASSIIDGIRFTRLDQ